MTKEKIARICSIENCEGVYEAKGFCNKHYIRFRKFGNPLVNHTPPKRQCSIEKCGKPHDSRGYCSMHLHRWRLYGSPFLNHPRMGRGETRVDRLWSKVDKTLGLGKDGNCWEWRGQRNGDYGAVNFHGKTWAVHRLIYFLTTGVKPSLFILHSCDNPLCVNPDHLREGTVQDNSNDMVERDRQAKGEKNGRAKLTDQLVKDARIAYQQGVTASEMARQLNVTLATLHAAIIRKTWRHVT